MKTIEPADFPHAEKINRMGHTATALLQLHLENPKEWDAATIVSKLFTEFENMELEEDLNGV